MAFSGLRKKLLFRYSAALGGIADPYAVVRDALISKPEFEGAFRAFDDRDLSGCLQRFLDLAQKGDPAAQHNLGILYETGSGVPKQDAAAEKWYREAARQGHPQAQFQLATTLAADLMAGQGSCTPSEAGERLTQAYMWLILASQGGHTEAPNSLDRLKPHLTLDQRTEPRS